MIFSRKEQKVKKLFLLHFDKVVESLVHLKDLLVYYLENIKQNFYRMAGYPARGGVDSLSS